MVLLCHTSFCGWLESIESANETAVEFRDRSSLDLRQAKLNILLARNGRSE